MTKIGIFYGSTTGNTQAAANEIKKQFENAELNDISSTSVEKMIDYDVLILGSSTWGFGDIQDDWELVLDSLGKLDFSGKKIALFGTGDQSSYDETFCDAIGILYETLQHSNVEFIGKWPTDTYEFTESKAMKEGMFVGLALDEDNQSDLTAKRIEDWIVSIKAEI